MGFSCIHSLEKVSANLINYLFNLNCIDHMNFCIIHILFKFLLNEYKIIFISFICSELLIVISIRIFKNIISKFILIIFFLKFMINFF